MNHSIIVNNATWLHYSKMTLGSSKLVFGPAWIWIGTVSAILFLIVCIMWVIARHVNRREEETNNYHKLGEPTISANFLMPHISETAPGLCPKISYREPKTPNPSLV